MEMCISNKVHQETKCTPSNVTDFQIIRELHRDVEVSADLYHRQIHLILTSLLKKYYSCANSEVKLILHQTSDGYVLIIQGINTILMTLRDRINKGNDASRITLFCEYVVFDNICLMSSHKNNKIIKWDIIARMAENTKM
jgi:hypothetical protein